MQKLWIGLLLLLLLVMGVTSAAADEGSSPDLSSGNGFSYEQANESDEATIRIIPDEGQVGESFTVLVTDLNANEEVSIRIIFVETNAEVYETTRTADDRGRVELNIFTESSDPAGEYRVELLNESDNVIAETSLVLEAVGGREGLLSISPSEGEVGTSFVIDISNVQDFADLTIVVTDEAGNEVYTTGIRASVDGTASVSFDSSEAAVGTLNVSVLQNETIPVASGSFTVQEEPFPATTVLEPNPAMPGDEVFVTVSGLEAEAAVTVVISNESGVLLSQDATANVSGLVIFSFLVSPEMALGEYEVEVLQGDTVLSRESWSLDVPAPTVTLSPTVGVPSSNFLVEVTTLNVGEEVVVELLEADTVLQSFTITANEEGYARAVVGQRLRLAIGDYEVRVLRSGQEVFTQTVSIVEERDAPETAGINPDDVTVTVSPESGPIPTQYNFTVEGLPANTDVTLNILFDGAVVYTVQGTSDAEGVFVSSVNSEATDPVGTYTLEVRADGQVIGSADFAIADEDAPAEATEEPGVEPTEEPTEAPSGDVSVRIEPATVVLGERFEIFVSNLVAGETVTIELRVDGESVYSSEQTADAAGAIGLALVTESSDPTGEYEILVLREDEEVASTSFEVVDSNANVSAAELSISPESAPLGSSHTISVSGLEAGETVTIVVEVDGSEIYSTEREADSEGVVTLVLNTESDDPVGDYTVNVEGENSELSGSFTVVEAEAGPANAGEFSITIDPTSGAIGTDHLITVRGLDAEETIRIQVEFDGELVYETEGTANEAGEFSLPLTTEEGDQAGEYTVTGQRDNGAEASASFVAVGETAVSSSDVVVSISPEEVNANENFEISVTGLDAGEEVTISVVYDGETVYETSREADTEGEIVFELSVEESDPEGSYTIEVERENGDTASADVLVLNDTAQVGDSDISIRVEPENGPIGTRHDFTISGLEAEETVAVTVEYDGEEVYSTEAVADENGEAVVSLTSEEGDSVGNYLLTVERENGDSASASFSVEAEGAVEGDGEGEDEGGVVDVDSEASIVFGEGEELFTGSISTEEPEARFTFEGEEGQGVQIEASSEVIDTYLILLDENGDEIASDDDGAGNLNSRIVTTLPYSGRYTIVVTSFSYVVDSDVEEGDFELSTQFVEVASTRIELGEGNQSMMDSLSEDRPQIEFVFSGEEGETLLLSADSTEFDTYLMLLDEDGEIIASNDDSNGTLNSLIGPFELPYSGDYTAVVTSYYYVNYSEVTSGEFSFRLESVEVSEIAYGEASEIEISADSATQFIEFDGNAGDVISISINSNDSIDTTISLLDPSGYALITDDDGGLGFDPEIERQVLPSDGTYVIMVRAFTLGDAGDIEVLVSLEDARTLDDSARLVRLNIKQDYDILVFEGVEGETVDMLITLEGGSVGSFTITVEQDSSSLMSYQSYAMGESIRLSFRVPADGIVRITLQDSSGSNVVLNVELERE
jgi:hypothetical protein